MSDTPNIEPIPKEVTAGMDERIIQEHLSSPQPTTTPPQSEERPKKDVAFVSYVTAKIPSHPDTLRENIKEILEQLRSTTFVTADAQYRYDPMTNKVVDRLLSLIAQERERIDDKWGKAWAELVENTDKETKELRERWENELREKVLALGSYMDRDSEYQDDGVYRDEVLALISNRKE